MFWLIAGVFVAAALFFMSRWRGSGSSTVRPQTVSAQNRAKLLPDDEKTALSAEIRNLATEQYDMAYATAINTGKNENFAHQVGVLRAVTSVVSMGQAVDSLAEKELQMETVPFNNTPSNDGKRAIVEYLVWKFFPDKSDENAFKPVLTMFRDKLQNDAKSEPENFLFEMLYCAKYDWQRYIISPPIEKSTRP
jgi:hypothetical protein